MKACVWFLVSLIIVVVVAVVSLNIGMRIGKTMSQNSYSRHFTLLISDLHALAQANKHDQLKQQLDFLNLRIGKASTSEEGLVALINELNNKSDEDHKLDPNAP